MASYDTGWVNLTTAGEQTKVGGFTATSSWVDPENALASDDSWSTNNPQVNKYESTHWLVLTGLIGHGIPSDAVITGVGIRIEGFQSASSPQTGFIPCVGGAIPEVSPAFNIGNLGGGESDAVLEYGEAGNLVSIFSSLEISRAEAVASDFGVALFSQNGSSSPVLLSIDHIQAKVFYDSDTGPVEPEAPDAVDDLAGAPGDEQISFTWTPPADNGAAITKYTLYLNGVEHTDSVTSPHAVTGLTNDTPSGPWTITATNSEGESDPSNSVTETPTAGGGSTGAAAIYYQNFLSR